MGANEEQARLDQAAIHRAQQVERLRRDWGDLTDEEVAAVLLPTVGHVVAPLVMQMRLIAAIGGLESALKRAEKLTWAIVGLTAVLLMVTIVLTIRS